MANIAPARNIQAAIAVGIVVAAGILYYLGGSIAQSAPALIGIAVPILTAWGHDISTGNNS